MNQPSSLSRPVACSLPTELTRWRYSRSCAYSPPPPRFLAKQPSLIDLHLNRCNVFRPFSAVWSLGGGGRGGCVTPLHKSYRCVPPQRIWFLCDFKKKGRLICEFEIDFKKICRWRSNLSNDDIVSAFARSEYRSSLFKARYENRCEK